MPNYLGNRGRVGYIKVNMTNNETIIVLEKALKLIEDQEKMIKLLEQRLKIETVPQIEHRIVYGRPVGWSLFNIF